MSKSNISRVRSSDVVAVNIGFVNAISAGMGIPRSMVARAALASAGIVIGVADWTIEEAVKRDTTLSYESKQTLLLMVQSMRIAGNDAAPKKNAESTDGTEREDGDAETFTMDDDDAGRRRSGTGEAPEGPGGNPGDGKKIRNWWTGALHAFV